MLKKFLIIFICYSSSIDAMHLLRVVQRGSKIASSHRVMPKIGGRLANNPHRLLSRIKSMPKAAQSHPLMNIKTYNLKFGKYFSTFPSAGARKLFFSKFINNNFGFRALLGIAGLTLAAEAKDEYEQQIKKLAMEQSLKQKKMLETVLDKDLTTLYESRSSFHLMLPEGCINCSSSDIKEMFARNGLMTAIHSISMKRKSPWTDKEWEEAKSSLLATTRSGGPNWGTGLCIDRSPQLLATAKEVLKSYVPDCSVEWLAIFDRHKGCYEYLKGNQFYSKGVSIDRLFVHAQLQKTITHKKLSHVHLPLKILVIKDKKNSRYITGPEAIKIIDDTFRMFASHADGHVTFDLISTEYDFEVLSHRQCGEGKLSENAFKDLETLIRAAPFDIGYQNILSTHNGDAIIIDTEFKGEPAEHCLPKLKRYRS